MIISAVGDANPQSKVDRRTFRKGHQTSVGSHFTITQITLTQTIQCGSRDKWKMARP